MWWKKHKWKVIVAFVAAAILAFAFWYGGDAPGSQGWNSSKVTQTPAVTANTGSEEESQAAESTDTPKTEATADAPETDTEKPADSMPAADETAVVSKKPSQEPIQEINPETGKDQYQTDPVPEDKPVPAEPEEAVIGNKSLSCTISIACNTILNNMELCEPEKRELVPEDGWILKPTTVVFYEGESVFNVLQRTCKQQRIHMEYKDTPIYNSAYIEGIGNLYEYDVGELSGWVYKVNEWFPNYGCSRYQLKDGDVIALVYTCDLGKDVGDNSLSLNGRN